MDKRNEVEVKLISYSKPSAEFVKEGLQNVQDIIAYCARVSNPANQYNTETSERLLRYCMRHKHWSIFEMASACLEIETTRDIAHQIVRHRSFSFQEFSQRYANPSEFGEQFVLREARLQDEKNRQNSVETDDEAIHGDWKYWQERVIDVSLSAYEWAIQNGVAKEQARVVLPEGLTKTRLMMNGTIRSWIHYIELRSANGTQKEHMEIAKECGRIISGIFPLIFKLEKIPQYQHIAD
jgi:thymidylate synthase (FAD)